MVRAGSGSGFAASFGSTLGVSLAGTGSSPGAGAEEEAAEMIAESHRTGCASWLLATREGTQATLHPCFRSWSRFVWFAVAVVLAGVWLFFGR